MNLAKTTTTVGAINQICSKNHVPGTSACLPVAAAAALAVAAVAVFINESEKRCLYNHVWWPPSDPPRTIAVQQSNCKLPLCRVRTSKLAQVHHHRRKQLLWGKAIAKAVACSLLVGVARYVESCQRDRQAAAAASSIYEPQTVCPFFYNRL